MVPDTEGAGTLDGALVGAGARASAGEGEGDARCGEMRAWINLTSGDYNGVVAAARHGTEITPHHSVAVQLFAQEAKA